MSCIVQVTQHAVCIPYPAQGHISPMLKLAKLLHNKGIHITFVNTEFHHKRLIKSRGIESVQGLPDFQFHTIPDGLPPTDADSTQDIPSLCFSTKKNCGLPFRNLLTKLTKHRVFLFWTTIACGFMGYLHCRHLLEKGLILLKDAMRSGNLSLPPMYTLGGLHLLINQIQQTDEIKSIGSNLWKEEPESLV
ncbi:hypothetical protein MKX01_015449 [Papaver californicum]|nr:hypothetical protein MKX01_015449 [Papaver californicum]